MRYPCPGLPAWYVDSRAPAVCAGVACGLSLPRIFRCGLRITLPRQVPFGSIPPPPAATHRFGDGWAVSTRRPVLGQLPDLRDRCTGARGAGGLARLGELACFWCFVPGRCDPPPALGCGVPRACCGELTRYKCRVRLVGVSPPQLRWGVGPTFACIRKLAGT